MAAGIFAIRNNYVYNKKADTILDIHGLQDLTPIDVYGTRGMMHMRFLGDSMIHGFVSYGFSLQLSDYLMNVGITFGVDNFN